MCASKHSEKKSLIVVGICGESGAGKSTSTEILKSHGFAPFSVSSLVREDVKSLYGDMPREEVQRYAREKQAEEGADHFARRFLQEYAPFEHTMVVLDGIRNRKELETLRKAAATHNGTFVMLGLVTDDNKRFTRVQSRGRSGDPATFAEFKEADMRSADHGDFQENRLLVEESDYRIVNDGTMEELEKSIMNLVDKIAENAGIYDDSLTTSSGLS